MFTAIDMDKNCTGLIYFNVVAFLLIDNIRSSVGHTNTVHHEYKIVVLHINLRNVLLIES